MIKFYSNVFKYVFLLLVLISCKSDKTPPWVNDPPPDDELNIYIVGVGKNDGLYQSVLNQIYERFSIPENRYFSELILTTLKDETNDNISIIDRWNSDINDYILVRLKRSFFDPILELYSTRYDEMINFSTDFELDGNIAYENGDLFNAFSMYVKALDEMLSFQDEFYTPSIVNVINKIQDLLSMIKYLDIEKFSELIIGKAISNEKFSFRVTGDENVNFDGFRYKISFSEGWDNRKRSAIIPIRNNTFKFIPTVPMVSSTSQIYSSLSIDNLLNVIDKWIDHVYLSNSIKIFKTNVYTYIDRSIIEFEYETKSNLKLFSKLISYDNLMVTEGIIRFLLENEDVSVSAPILLNDDNLLSYVRELTTITENQYKYLVLGNEIKEDRVVFDEKGLLITLSTSFDLIDMQTAKVIQTQKIKTEYIGESGDEDFAYLDLGLKIGDIVYNMKF